MASVNTGPGQSSNGKKSLDAELNLVPFIDLLSMCICFLLMTAVWIQVGSVQVKQSHGTDAAATPNKSFEIEVKMTKRDNAEVILKTTAGKVQKKVVVSGANEEEFHTKFIQNVTDLVNSLGGAEPFKMVSSSMVHTHPEVPYGEMVAVLDGLRKNQITNIGVVPAGAGAVK